MRIILNIIRLMKNPNLTLLKFALKALAIGFLAIATLSSAARADGQAPELKFENGHFEPASFVVAANTAFKLTVVNKGDSPIEFESFELNRERVVQPGHSIVVQLPKLDPGQYHFFDDFHHDVAQGTITAQ